MKYEKRREFIGSASVVPGKNSDKSKNEVIRMEGKQDGETGRWMEPHRGLLFTAAREEEEEEKVEKEEEEEVLLSFSPWPVAVSSEFPEEIK